MKMTDHLHCFYSKITHQQAISIMKKITKGRTKKYFSDPIFEFEELTSGKVDLKVFYQPRLPKVK